MNKIIVSLLLLLMSTSSFAREARNDVLQQMNFDQVSICMIRSDNGGLGTGVTDVTVSCDGVVVTRYSIETVDRYFITSSQRIAKILIEKGFKLSGVASDNVLIFTK